jgi:low affinity Fe/Cu permease
VNDELHAADQISRDPGPSSRIARKVTHWTGSWWAIAVVLIWVAGWLVVGVLSDFPKAWELSATAGVPLLTLVLLIIVQRTQSHDDHAIQLKLDELIRVKGEASDSMIRAEEGSSEDLDKVRHSFRDRAEDSQNGR